MKCESCDEKPATKETDDMVNLCDACFEEAKNAMVDPVSLPQVNYVSDQIHDGPRCNYCGAVMTKGKRLSCGGTEVAPVSPEPPGCCPCEKFGYQANCTCPCHSSAYWKSRAETAELKVLTFHEEIASLREAGAVGARPEAAPVVAPPEKCDKSVRMAGLPYPQPCTKLRGHAGICDSWSYMNVGAEVEP